MSTFVRVNGHKELQTGIVTAPGDVDSEPLDQIGKLADLYQNSENVSAEIREKAASGEWTVRNVMPQMQLVQIPATWSFSKESALFKSIAVLYKNVFQERWDQVFPDIDATMDYFIENYGNANAENVHEGTKMFISVAVLNGIPLGVHIAFVGDSESLVTHAIDAVRGNYEFTEGSMVSSLGTVMRDSKLREMRQAMELACPKGANIGYQAELFMLEEDTIVYLIGTYLEKKELKEFFTEMADSSKPQDFDAPWLERLMRTFIVFLNNRGLEPEKIRRYDEDRFLDAVKRLIGLIIVGSGLDFLKTEKVSYILQWTAEGFAETDGKKNPNAMASIFKAMMVGNKDAVRRNLIKFISAFQDKKWLQYSNLRSLVKLANETSIVWQGQVVDDAFKDHLDKAPSSTNLLVVGLPIDLVDVVTNFILYKLSLTRDWHPRDLLHLVKDDVRLSTQVLLALFN